MLSAAKSFRAGFKVSHVRSQLCHCRFSTSARRSATRAITYKTAGDPTSVLRALTYPALSSPPSKHVNVRFLLSPINPADINVVEGVYPLKPSPDASLTGEPLLVGGNEGLAEVIEVGEGVSGVKKGDWVVMATQQLGTWASARTVLEDDVVTLPKDISQVIGATITVSAISCIALTGT